MKNKSLKNGLRRQFTVTDILVVAVERCVISPFYATVFMRTFYFFECAGGRGIEIRNDIGIVVCNRVNGINARVALVTGIYLILVSREKTPSAIVRPVSHLAIHIAYFLPFDHDPIAGKTATHRRHQLTDFFFRYGEFLLAQRSPVRLL
jgi:hypothetical protein